MDPQADGTMQAKPGRTLRRLFFSAGTAYGLVFGFFFALITWGYDGLVLARNGADLPWAKLELGLPVSVLAGVLMGWLGALVDRAWFSAIMGAITGGFLSWLAGHLPYEGVTRVTAWLDPRFAGLEMAPFGPSATARLVLAVLVGVGLGALIGALQSWAVDRAWDRSTPEERMTLRSWIVLLISIPLFLPLALFVDLYVDAPLRGPQLLVGTLVRLTATGNTEEIARLGLNNRSIQPFAQSLSANFTSYLVEYDQEAMYYAYVDVVMDNGLVLRCSSGGDKIFYCGDISAHCTPWMDNLVHAGLTGERRWADEQPRNQDVSPGVLQWLQAHADELQGTYQVRRLAQRGGWLMLSARFDNGFELVCRMSGAGLEVVDWCGEADKVTR